MSQCVKNLYNIFNLTKLFSCNEIKLFAWNENHKLLVLYVRNGDFIYYNVDVKNPIIKQIPWFRNPLHTPVAIDFSPTGCFLVVLSKCCNLYILPVCSVFECTFQCDLIFDNSDVTVYTYPFSLKKLEQNEFKSKSPNSNLNTFDHLPQSVSCTDLNERLKKSSNASDIFTNGTKTKQNEVFCSKNKISPSAVCWWQSMQKFQEVAIIGTKSGDIIFVDLVRGMKIGETCVKGEIKNLTVCQDVANNDTFLLVTVENDEQYKLTLEQKHLIYISPREQLSNSTNDVEPSEVLQSSHGNGNSSSRTRLQELKQISVGKLASLKNKITETRSKINARPNACEESSGRNFGSSPENLKTLIGDTVISCQSFKEENVLVRYYAHTQLLTIHSMNLDVVPRFAHKMPTETEEILLCNRIIYIISKNRKTVQVISSKLTEIQDDQTSDFHSDSLLGNWTFQSENEGISNFENSCQNLKPKQSMFCDGFHGVEEEIILGLYKSVSKYEDSDIFEIYKLEKADFPEFPEIENCIVVTNQNVYIIHLKSNILKIALDLILEAELEKAEKICSIFEINLQKLLELAGDIKLNASEFPTAFALYKLSKCSVLKGIVKLACRSHCSQVLNYSLMSISSSASEMPLTEKIHLSNLIIMAYTQQILKNENNRKLMEKFIQFLKTNSYFDEVLAVSVTGQSLLFTCLQNLITHKGLIMDGYSVLIKLMERFLHSKTLDWTSSKKEFWHCASEIGLTEAIVIKLWCFPTYFNYVSRHLSTLDVVILDRLLALLDPTAACVRPLARLFQNADESYDNDEAQSVFPFGSLVELFLLTLIVKLHKNKNEEENYEREFLLPFKEQSDTNSFSVGDDHIGRNVKNEYLEDLNDEIWPMRKNSKPLQGELFRNRLDSILSCGYGHTALIRNGSVYTWGQTAKGCLGQGPTMLRYSSPSPISWLNCFKLEVSLVACGKNHTAALTNNGVYTWGCSKYGQLGLGEVYESPYPRLVKDLANESVIALSCGQFHTLALTAHGSVFAWGWGIHGQLGLGNIDDQRQPKCVKALKEHFIVDIAAGHGHSLALSDKGHVYSFGSSVFGQLGTGSTRKCSVPTLVQGLNERIVAIATGYFHNLALSESNSLYTWGSSPQCLRLQAQARKKLKLLQNQNTTTPCDFDLAKSPTEECLRLSNETSEEGGFLDKTSLESHLSPCLVNTSNVVGKITQISCGCHHSALLTDSGGIYTWGRSLDGQLGNGGHKEIRIPTQVNTNSFKADCVSCGCEFTAAQERHTGKIYTWGSNSVGQLAVPVKESVTKSLDGKLVMLKSCKRIFRIIDRNGGSNSVSSPKEILEIPVPTFTYHPLSKHLFQNSQSLSTLDPEYSHRSLHFVIENFSQCINLNLIFDKCVEYSNYQAASKISLLQNSFKQSIIYQLKALQSLRKYHLRSAPYYENEEKFNKSANSSEARVDLFSAECGQEETFNKACCNDVTDTINNQKVMEGDETISRSIQLLSKDNSSFLKTEYIDHAKYIIDTYLNLNSNQDCEKLSKCSILEIGIQFWIAEKLPIDTLENFFIEKLDYIFYDIAYLLFCQSKDNQMPFTAHFSSKFLLAVISKMLNLIKNNGSCVEYLEIMSKILVNHEFESKTGLPKKKRSVKRKKQKSESYLEVIEENLREPWINCNYIRITCGDINSENIYFFSCGHSHSLNSIKNECKIFEEINNGKFTSNFVEVYEDLINGRINDSSCPACVNNYLR